MEGKPEGPTDVTYLFRESQDLRSIFRDLIPELMLSQSVIYTWAQFATIQEL
jgi:hypothetical protein